MKKYLLVSICALLLLAVGCGKKNQLNCSGKLSQNGATVKVEVNASLDKKDKITDATVIYDLGDKESANQYCNLFKMMEDTDKGISIKCSGTKVTINGFAEAGSNADGNKIAGTSKKDFIKLMEDQNLSCK